MTDRILLELSDQIATVTFNNPKRRNAITFEMWLHLRRLLVDLNDDPDVRVIVFRGADDDAFSAGADISEFETHRKNAAQAALYNAAFDAAMEEAEAVGKPTISLIKGACVGGGCEFSSGTFASPRTTLASAFPSPASDSQPPIAKCATHDSADRQREDDRAAPDRGPHSRRGGPPHRPRQPRPAAVSGRALHLRYGPADRRPRTRRAPRTQTEHHHCPERPRPQRPHPRRPRARALPIRHRRFPEGLACLSRKTHPLVQWSLARSDRA
jgi:hypothetical protein